MAFKSIDDGMWCEWKDVVFEREHKWFKVEFAHALNQADPEHSGWRVAILWHDWKTGTMLGETNVGWYKSYTECVEALNKLPLFKKHPYPCE